MKILCIIKAETAMWASLGIGDFKTSQPPKFCLPIFWIKFKSSIKILVQGGRFA